MSSQTIVYPDCPCCGSSSSSSASSNSASSSSSGGGGGGGGGSGGGGGGGGSSSGISITCPTGRNACFPTVPSYTVTVSGATNSSCSDCANANGTFTLNRILPGDTCYSSSPDCLYRSNFFTLCGNPTYCYYLSVASSMGVFVYNLNLVRNCGGFTAVAWSNSALTDCSGGTLALVYNGVSVCQNWSSAVVS